jgi:hypothetical protein
MKLGASIGGSSPALGVSEKVLRRVQHENQRIEGVLRFSCQFAKLLDLLVDLIGIEPDELFHATIWDEG